MQNFNFADGASQKEDPARQMVILFEVLGKSRRSDGFASSLSKNKTAFVGIESLNHSEKTITSESVARFDVLFDAISTSASLNELCRILAGCSETFDEYCFRCSTQTPTGDVGLSSSTSVKLWNSDGLNVEYVIVGSPLVPSIRVISEEQAVCALSVSRGRDMEVSRRLADNRQHGSAGLVLQGWDHSGAEMFRASNELELAPFSVLLVPNEVVCRFRSSVVQSPQWVLAKTTIGAISDIVENGVDQNLIAIAVGQKLV